ncbi:serine protease snake [Anastrepha obliqua]|uniref:serine protease snake n=1 Tax=Anastrepha obliqua TaxID=95512 RepID=UPI00240A9770|nr:serine protease snake [Anastrepha obliqua]
MCVKTVTILLASLTVLYLVQAHNRFAPIQPLQQHNDVFENPVKRIDEFELEVDILVKPNPMAPAMPNLNIIVSDAKIIPPGYAEEQAWENRRHEFNMRDRGPEFHNEQERDSIQRQEFHPNAERRPDHNRGFNGPPEWGIDRNSLLNQVAESDIDPNRQPVNPPKQQGKPRRLCERKYSQYIQRIFNNDEDTTADANDSEFDGRILASPGEYPHMTALGFQREDNSYDYKCGGSLISENFVITAAHCTNVTGEVPTVARIGDLNLLVDEKNLAPQIFRIRNIYTHPQYDGTTYYNDIALLQLNASIEFTEFVRPIRLWTRTDLPIATAFAMGYGATSFAHAPTQRLTDFNMTLIANDECNEQLPQLDEVPRGIIQSQMCAEDLVMHRDTCQGDSGGPLQYNIRGRRRTERIHYHLIGITSFGLLCRSPNPGVYTRIFSFLDWIERTAWSST